MPTTLADLFEYLSSCDEAVLPHMPAEDEEQDDDQIYKVSDILLNYLSVHDIMHMRMVCKSTA